MKNWKSNKPIQILLLTLVLGIWSYAAYKYFSVEDVPVVDIARPSLKRTEEQGGNRSEKTLMLNYPDPFLKGEIQYEEEPIEETDAQPEEPQSIIVVTWPKIQYNGIMKNASQKKEIALISLDGQSYLVKPGEQKLGLKVLKIYRDSIILSYSGEQKTYYAN